MIGFMSIDYIILSTFVYIWKQRKERRPDRRTDFVNTYTGLELLFKLGYIFVAKAALRALFL